MVACSIFQAEQTVFDLSTYPQQFQGKTVKVKCQKVNPFAAAFFCDDGTTPEDVLEIDPDSVDKDSLRYLKAHCNEPSAQCSGSVTGRFEMSKYGDIYIRDATFKFTGGGSRSARENLPTAPKEGRSSVAVSKELDLEAAKAAAQAEEQRLASAAAAQKSSRTSQISIETVAESIRTMGPEQTLEGIYNDPEKWRGLLDGIGTGEEKWLTLARQLRAVSDAGASEQLDLAVGEALEHRPREVLRAAVTSYGIGFVCSGPEVDDPRFDSYDSAISAINRRLKALRTIEDADLIELRDACISKLVTAKMGIARFYGRMEK